LYSPKPKRGKCTLAWNHSIQLNYSSACDPLIRMGHADFLSWNVQLTRTVFSVRSRTFSIGGWIWSRQAHDLYSFHHVQLGLCFSSHEWRSCIFWIWEALFHWFGKELNLIGSCDFCLAFSWDRSWKVIESGKSWGCYRRARLWNLIKFHLPDETNQGAHQHLQISQKRCKLFFAILLFALLTIG